jgi:hypothetical protein
MHSKTHLQYEFGQVIQEYRGFVVSKQYRHMCRGHCLNDAANTIIQSLNREKKTQQRESNLR